ncbi:hypothetical protein HDU67_004848, partial [Dinochytrium kinnereticum]
RLSGESHEIRQKALTKEIAYKQKNRAASLEQELMNFAQEAGESDVGCADRMQDLVLRFAAIGVPDPTKPDLQKEFKLKIALIFLNGLEGENRKRLRLMFRSLNVEEEFESMREELIEMETEDMLAAGQRKRIHAANAQRALSAQGRKETTGPPTAGSFKKYPAEGKGDPKTVFLGNLPYEVSTDAVREEMKKYGSLSDVSLKKGYGFATYYNVEEAKAAIAAGNVEIGGRKFFIQGQKKKEDRAEKAQEKIDDELPAGFALAALELGDDDDDDDLIMCTDQNEPTNSMSPAYSFQHHFAFMAAEGDDPMKNHVLEGFIDSGCTSHLSPDHEKLTNTRSCPRSSFSTASGNAIKGSGVCGDFVGYAESDNTSVLEIKGIKHVPDAAST